MRAIKFIFFLLIIGVGSVNNLCYSQNTSVLNNGTWLKFSVTYDGAFKIDYNQLKSAGINPDQINPKKIKIYTGYNGMLPQANDNPINGELVEIPILISGEADSQFNSSDYILFFGKGPDVYSFDIDNQIFNYQNNLFTDKNYYFLTVSTEDGKRITDSENIQGTYPIINSYNDFAYYETEKYNILKSGRQWFGEQFDANTEATIRFDIPGIIDNTEIKLVSQVMAQSINPSSFQVSINNVSILDQPITEIPNTSYGIKGRIKTDTISFLSGQIGASSKNNQDVTYKFNKGASGLSVGYLDFILLSFERKLALYGNQSSFQSIESINNNISSFEINSSGAGIKVWNITSPFEVKNQLFASSSSITFSTNTNELQSFLIFQLEKIEQPKFESKIENQNLHQLGAPNLLIISHASLTEAAHRLSQHRQSHDGISSNVVTTEQIYNEFSGGKQDFTALRNFIKYLYSQAGSSLKYVLLFGRGSYDYRSRVLNNTNLVPIYESRNSLSPLETYASDDYYGFMESSEGEWLESSAQNHTMDIGIGRIPAKNLEEANIIVDKFIEYDTKMNEPGPWQNEFLFVADDGDFNIHMSQADQLANSIELYDSAFNVKKFYLDSFEQLDKPSGQYSPAAQKELDLQIRKGYAIVNFTGHGSEQVWMDERILDENIIQNWKQGSKYPLFVTATCEFGRNDDPFQISSGEKTLLQKKGGSIGIVTTSRPVNASTNFTLNKAFYESLFIKENNSFREIGSILRDTKNKSLSGVANRNFSLLGDPSMKLILPNYRVIIDNIKTNKGSNELKGLSRIIVDGHIEKDATPFSEFSGEITLTVYDEEILLTTKGDENPPFNFTQRENALFRGSAYVESGTFNLEFVMPKNVSHNLITGKFSAIASSTSNEFAVGTIYNSYIGGIDEDAVSDNTPPKIKLYMGDTTFINGGKVGPNTKIVAYLEDESGINISDRLPENNIIVQVDETDPMILNSYYSTEIGTYKKGSLNYPVEGLEKGLHHLTFTASDNYNNITTSQLDFTVTDGVDIQIEEFFNYPNPFYENTKFEFTHTRPGEDIEAMIVVYELSGKPVLSQEFEVLNSQYRVTLAEWDGKDANGRKFAPGMYLAKLSVRSLLDGSKNEEFAKLIILN